ncbi:MAG: hypothetical protein MHM6MM_001386 [Cercozoa sp. M6MM]
MELLEQVSHGASRLLMAPENYEFDRDAKAFVTDNKTLVWTLLALYCPVIFTLRKIFPMPPAGEKRPKDSLLMKTLLVLWNFGLASFSFLAFLSLLPLWIRLIRGESYDAVCYDAVALGSDPRGWAMFLFNVSKIVEFGDTVFLALRRRPIIALHWTHHVLTCAQGLLNMSYVADPVAMHGTCINLFVHSIMYTYYAVSAMGVRFPKPIRMSITFVQTSQMFAMSYVIVPFSFVPLTPSPCYPRVPLVQYKRYMLCPEFNSTILMFAAIMYVYYVVVFSKLFYDLYFKPKDSKSKPAKLQKKLE